MKAIGVMTFGEPEVLHVVELPEPHAGAAEVRIRAHAASDNPALPQLTSASDLHQRWLPAVSKEGEKIGLALLTLPTLLCGVWKLKWLKRQK